MDPIVLFLRKDILPEDKSEANKVRRQIFVSQSHHSGLLVAKYTKISVRICEEM